MPELAFESTPQKAPQKDYQPPTPEASDVLLKGLMEKRAKLNDLIEKIKNAPEKEAEIYEFDKIMLEKQIEQYKKSLNRHIKIEKNDDLIKAAGKNNVIDMQNFKKRPKSDENDNELQVSDNFLNSIKEFKDNKRRAQL